MKENKKDYMDVKQASEKWGVNVQRVRALLEDDRVPGAHRDLSHPNGAWRIPADAPKPERLKPGKKTTKRN